MLYYLAELSQNLSILNVFRYITFRSGGAFFTALLFGFLFVADKRLKFETIDRVMKTCARAGFTKFRFAVAKK